MSTQNAYSKLDNISYISIPEQLATKINNFEIDPKILLPVELENGINEDALKNLSWEMIVSACLKIIAYKPFDENSDYYRKFVSAIKPNIIEELTSAGIVKAKNRDYDLAEEIFLSIANLKETETTVSNLALIYEEHASVYEQLGNFELYQEYIKKTEEAYNRFANFETVSESVLYNLAFFKIKTGKI
ncbi:MAG: hypothetical protein JXR63_09025, partial [Spirochaetales bacterium]|nr:hypothetical protein [Spirochaetales bacterium]